jgi:hypothetical protein
MIHNHPTYAEFMVSERINTFWQQKQALRLARATKGQMLRGEGRPIVSDDLSAGVDRVLAAIRALYSNLRNPQEQCC